MAEQGGGSMLLRGEAIGDLAALLSRRRASFFHACQLEDFHSYNRLGGIPARSLLKSNGLAHTSFTSDERDQEYGVYDKVFGNLQDFGGFFARGAAAVPCVYGPILFILKPSCFIDADDVAICLRSASGDGFDRERESLTSIEQVDSLYYDESSKYPQDIRSREELAERFPQVRDVRYPEVSISVREEMISFEHVQYIRLDPYYSPGGISLVDIVRESYPADSSGRALPVYKRDQGRPERLDLYRVLGERLTNSTPSLQELREDSTAPASLRNWAASLGVAAAGQYRRAYMPYLKAGTLPQLAEQDTVDLTELPF